MENPNRTGTVTVTVCSTFVCVDQSASLFAVKVKEAEEWAKQSIEADEMDEDDD